MSKTLMEEQPGTVIWSVLHYPVFASYFESSRQSDSTATARLDRHLNPAIETFLASW